MVDNLAPVEIAEGTYWVGKRDPDSIFHANPYLRVFAGTDRHSGRANHFNLLVDPGSSSDFAIVSQKVAKIIGGVQNVSAIFLNHQDPDVGSSTPMITARFAPRASVVCSEDTFRLIVHQGLSKDRFVATERAKNGVLALPTGHNVLPIPSPYCHFRGAVMLYDPATRVLFTGDLFGGLTEKGAKKLIADESDWKGIRAFHQIYMPTNAALRRAVDTIRALDPKPEVLAPQHGSIAQGALVDEWLDRLYHLPVGLDILDEDDDSTLDGWNHVLARVIELSRGLLGPAAEARLADDRSLEDTLSFEGQELRITSLGRFTMEKVLEALTRFESPAFANVLRMEAVGVADQLGLPVPRIQLEDAGDSELTDRDPSMLL